MMEQPFSVVPRGKRASERASYVERLRAKNGAPSWESRTLSAREPRFRSLLAARPEAGVRLDQPTFERAFAAPSGAAVRAASPLLLWCLALARIHAAERYSETQGMGAPRSPDSDDPLVHIELEEAYHTRAVQEILATLGLSFTPPPPDAATRALVHSMSVLPAAPAEIAIFCAERVGTVAFELLLAKAPDVLTGPQLTHIERLLADVVADEREHVAHARRALSAWQMALARAAFPVVVRLTLRELPELPLLIGEAPLRDALWRGSAAP
jgi:hypothetical protein